MPPFKKILVPVDFSLASHHALALAAELARHFDGELTIAHVYDPAPYALPEGAWDHTKDQRAQLTAELERRLAAAKGDAERAGAPRVTTRLLQGAPVAAIIELAHAGSFDAVVVGPRGHSAMERLLIGSVAERVTRAVNCAVVIARPTQEPPSSRPGLPIGARELVHTSSLEAANKE